MRDEHYAKTTNDPQRVQEGTHPSSLLSTEYSDLRRMEMAVVPANDDVGGLTL